MSSLSWYMHGDRRLWWLEKECLRFGAPVLQQHSFLGECRFLIRLTFFSRCFFVPFGIVSLASSYAWGPGSGARPRNCRLGLVINASLQDSADLGNRVRRTGRAVLEGVCPGPPGCGFPTHVSFRSHAAQDPGGYNGGRNENLSYVEL